jgi:hypothetical protein
MEILFEADLSQEYFTRCCFEEYRCEVFGNESFSTVLCAYENYYSHMLLVLARQEISFQLLFV